MIDLILNDQDIATDLPEGMTVLDFVRYRQDLKGTKIGCREGDCGACTVLVGELLDGDVRYRSMTSCLMPLANAAGKHIVTVEGINPENRGLTPVQQAMVDESGTQCGFCTVGFVMSLTGFCLNKPSEPDEMQAGSLRSDAISAIDGNICRCTGYKSIERAAAAISNLMSEPGAIATGFPPVVPPYFADIPKRLARMVNERPPKGGTQNVFVGGGTDVYVQKPDAMAESDAAHLLYDHELRGIRDTGTHIEIGASVTVTDLLESSIMNAAFPDLYKHLKLVSSTPIRNMATLAGNFVNASPIGDMTVWFLALDTEIELAGGNASVNERAESNDHVGTLLNSRVSARTIPLRDLYLGYKQLAKSHEEYITAIRFKKPTGDFRFNFEKVCKRTYLDIASVNTATSLTVRSTPGEGWLPPVLSEPGATVAGPTSNTGTSYEPEPTGSKVNHEIVSAHVAAGGVSPIPLYLKKTSEFLVGKLVDAETISAANVIMQSEISPISDVRGTEQYKRLLLRQLFCAHFYEMFGI
ncbi:MAG: FAD binding domain-containing protein [Pyrinomonadaceae bacterium]|nr:FAD binding domain-containing protein [Pyrinomonadaceae bacterium]